MITVEMNGAVARIIMDDGGLNILTPEAVERLLHNIAIIEADDEVKTVLLEGNGRSFSAGLDLRVLRAGGDDAITLLRQTGKLLKALYSSPFVLEV